MLKKTSALFFIVVFSWLTLVAEAATSTLPPNLIALSSAAGEKLFNRSYSANYFWPLALQFVTQQNLTYCSIASSVVVLNALDSSAPVDPVFTPFKIFTQNNFFTPAVEKILPAALVKKQGATLAQISQALTTFPLSVKTVYANTMTADQFRSLAKKVIADQKAYIIVNFIRTGLDEQGAGHMSPLAAYDKSSDRFLMLDVARYRYPSAWVKTPDLWKAMDTVDKDANAYRGFIVVAKKD